MDELPVPERRASEQGSASSGHVVVLAPLSRARWMLRRATRNVPRALLLVTLLSAFVWTSQPLEVAGAVGLLGLFALGIAAALGRARPTQVSAQIDAEGVRWEGGAVPRSGLVAGTVARVDGDWELELRGRAPVPWAMKVASDIEARRIIDALGLGLDRRVHRFDVTSRLVGGPAWAALALAYATYLFSVFLSSVSPTLAVVTGVAAAVGALLALVLRVVPGQLVVGRDALRYAWLGHQRTYPLRDLRSAHVAPVGAPGGTHRGMHRVILHFEDGTSAVIPVSSAPKGDPAGIEEASRIAEAIEAAQRQRARVAPSVSFEAWMASRRAAPMASWLEALRAHDARYRDASEIPFTLEELGAVVEDPAADPQDRLAAAVALVSRGAADRVLSVSRTTAIVPLLDGLRAAVASDDAGIERARLALADAPAPEHDETSAPRAHRARR